MTDIKKIADIIAGLKNQLASLVDEDQTCDICNTELGNGECVACSKTHTCQECYQRFVDWELMEIKENLADDDSLDTICPKCDLKANIRNLESQRTACRDNLLTIHDIVAEIREANVFLREALGVWADLEWSTEEVKNFEYLIPIKKAYEMLRDY